MARAAKARAPRALEAKAHTPAPAPAARGLRWPVWASVTLVGLYLLLHASMIPIAFELWGGLLSALLFGR